MKVLVTFLLALAVLPPLPVLAADAIVVNPSGIIYLNRSGQKTKDITLVPSPGFQYLPQWEASKGTCNTRRIATLLVDRIRRPRDNGTYYFLAIVVAVSPGACAMWIKAGPVEVSVPVLVEP